MLRLCGFHISNYHNKVRIALLGKGIEHLDDSGCKPSQDEAFLARSPMGKVPFLEIDDRRISESQVICEYLEDAYPHKPLLPKDPWERAKVRELITFMELHLELVARRLYPAVFFKKEASPETKASVEKGLMKGIRAFRDFLEEIPQVKPYIKTVGERPAFKRVNDDRKAAQAK